MLQFKEGSARVLAEDVRTTLADIDRTLGSSFRMSGNIPEVFEGAGVPANASQKVYKQMSDSIAQIVAGRGNVVSAIAHLQVLHQRSNVAETDFGCLAPWFTEEGPVSATHARELLPHG